MQRTHTPLFSCCYGLILALIVTCSIKLYAQDRSAPSHTKMFLDLPEILERGILRVAMLKTDELPFFYHDESGNFTGIDVELLHLIEDKMGVKIELIRTSPTFDGVVDMVAYGEADLGLSYISTTIERSKRVTYTIPYAFNYFAIAVNRVAQARSRTGGDPNAFFNRTETKLGVQMDSTYEGFARRNFPDAALVGMADSNEIARAVADGEIDAAVSATLSLEPMMKKSPELNFLLKVITYYNEPDLMAATVHPKSLHLLNWMNTFISQLELLGTLDQIKQRHGISVDKEGKK